MNQQSFRTTLFALAAIVVIGSAHAISITPLTPALAYGSDNANPGLPTIQALTGNGELFLAYKKNTVNGGGAGGTEEGSFTASYNTVTDSDNTGGTITHVLNTAFINSDDIFMVVKDGNHSPYWYLFDISYWNGTDMITLSGFWPQGGEISNVAIYAGEPPTTVPDSGATALLIGFGLTALLVAGRRMKSS